LCIHESNTDKLHNGHQNPQTSLRIARQSRQGEVPDFLRGNGAPGAIPTREPAAALDAYNVETDEVVQVAELLHRM
jgi:hypothetical protein